MERLRSELRRLKADIAKLRHQRVGLPSPEEVWAAESRLSELYVETLKAYLQGVDPPPVTPQLEVDLKLVDRYHQATGLTYENSVRELEAQLERIAQRQRNEGARRARGYPS